MEKRASSQPILALLHSAVSIARNISTFTTRKAFEMTNRSAIEDIHKLEDIFSVSIIQVNENEAIITPAGRIMIKHAEIILANMKALENELLSR